MTNEELEQVYDCLDGGFGETSGKLSAHITALESEIERLKRDLKQMEVQDQIVIDTLRNENERLTKKLAFEKSQAEGWRDRAEKLEHENHPEHFDRADHISHDSEMVTHHEELCVARSEHCYNPLKMFYEIAERYFSVSTPQDLENALKEQRETNVIVHKDFIEHNRKETERLKCLALHLFIQVSYHEYKDWGRIRDTFPQSHASDLKERSVRNAERWCRINKRSYEAYRKAKAALREGK